MKPFEMLYMCCRPGLPVLYSRVRRSLKKVKGEKGRRPHILDVGGRTSHYTIGLPASVTITDLPRRSAVQEHLHLGVNDDIVGAIWRRRSNVAQVLVDDMTCSHLGSASFECAVAVEVLEHVEDDAAFVREVRRVLKPNGVFVMTTPNGDSVKNTNPDHKRHYRRPELEALLRREFESVDVQYAIPSGRFYALALESWSLRRPLRTFLAYAGSLLHSIQDRYARPNSTGQGMQHLIAVARTSKQS